MFATVADRRRAIKLAKRLRSRWYLISTSLKHSQHKLSFVPSRVDLHLGQVTV
jgi:hypothetical protein